MSSGNQNQTTDLVETFLNNQTKELEIRAEELALQKQKDEHGFEFGKAALKAKTEDRNSHRKYTFKTRIYTYLLIGIIVLSVVGIIFYAMYSGNKEIAMEIIKAIIYLSGGGLGGYGAAKAGKPSSNINNVSKK